MTAETVLGPVAGSDLGVTLIHEHLHADFTPLLDMHGYTRLADRALVASDAAEARWNPGAFPDNYRLSADVVTEELDFLRRAGCSTVVDATPSHLGRDPTALMDIARRTGLNIVMGCGWYVEACHPPEVRELSLEGLTDILVSELQDGVNGTGIRPGIVGEIGTSHHLTRSEEKVVRAAALAADDSGLALTIHLHPWSTDGLTVAAAAISEGLRPERLVLNHVTTALSDIAYLRALADTGAFLAFDLFGFDHSCLACGRYPPSDYDVAVGMVRLAEDGHITQLLASQDIGVKTRLHAFGGWGYDHLLVHVVPLLAACGFDDDALRVLLVENPCHVLERIQACDR